MTESTQPTIVLVHGAFAAASGFAGVIGELAASGYQVLAPPNPLRGLASDAAAVRAVVTAVGGPVLLAGHPYGGAVITQASAGLDNVTGLVPVRPAVPTCTSARTASARPSAPTCRPA